MAHASDPSHSLTQSVPSPRSTWSERDPMPTSSSRPNRHSASAVSGGARASIPSEPWSFQLRIVTQERESRSFTCLPSSQHPSSRRPSLQRGRGQPFCTQPRGSMAPVFNPSPNQPLRPPPPSTHTCDRGGTRRHHRPSFPLTVDPGQSPEPHPQPLTPCRLPCQQRA